MKALIALTAVVATAAPAFAQNYPTKPVRFIYEYVTWYGVLAPAGTPRDIVTRLNAELVKIAQSPEIKQRLATEGGEIVGSTPEEFAAYIKQELKASADLVKLAHVKPD